METGQPAFERSGDDNKAKDKHVDATCESTRDAGSTPATSTTFLSSPSLEGLLFE